MIYTWVIILILALGLISGYRSGFVTMLVRLVAYAIAWLLTMAFSDKLAQLLYSAVTNGSTASTITVPRAFSGILFFVMFSVIYGIVRRIGSDLNIITRLPLIHQANALLGAAISFIIRYLFIFLVLNVLLLFSTTWTTSQYQNSSLAQTIVKKTPVVSGQLYRQWQDSRSSTNN
ncbi:hypothetical protein AYR62_03735 [Secundilactobacillus paracollinoides]|uniref:Colicin V production protein n=1 Tax=Secundilactobacillus paracollinoides TaxID=240427 RepID=A0A1B2J015_9LACO|nr:CvpA family protein [Secundilactobacillus paracollinoides]ANZ61662.1 hypothetical protein AYR61_10025 [Secundilactobacillus paracollinoides]ANZ63299.1 hypothetical protein AYR62_03735 [Secundilactobacillus paracollinoides]ANZ67580.1 hypothetical protein AYR63_10770 [Secundilactobacillus paracollinoides]KRL76025.1 hypothetical protein FC17_GL002339 [Secundilactobacillus paracollinoides DSM 15502 = JCM 11969]